MRADEERVRLALHVLLQHAGGARGSGCVSRLSACLAALRLSCRQARHEAIVRAQLHPPVGILHPPAAPAARLGTHHAAIALPGWELRVTCPTNAVLDKMVSMWKWLTYPAWYLFGIWLAGKVLVWVAMAAYHAGVGIAQRLTCNASAHYPCEPMYLTPSAPVDVMPASAVFLACLLYGAAVQAVKALPACLAAVLLLAVGSIGVFFGAFGPPIVWGIALIHSLQALEGGICVLLRMWHAPWWRPGQSADAYLARYARAVGPRGLSTGRLTLALQPPHPNFALVGMLIKTTTTGSSAAHRAWCAALADEQRTYHPAPTDELRLPQGLHSSLLPCLPRLRVLCVSTAARPQACR